jgi:hypothetical protein
VTKLSIVGDKKIYQIHYPQDRYHFEEEMRIYPESAIEIRML